MSGRLVRRDPDPTGRGGQGDQGTASMPDAGETSRTQPASATVTPPARTAVPAPPPPPPHPPCHPHLAQDVKGLRRLSLAPEAVPLQPGRQRGARHQAFGRGRHPVEQRVGQAGGQAKHLRRRGMCIVCMRVCVLVWACVLGGSGGCRAEGVAHPFWTAACHQVRLIPSLRPLHHRYCGDKKKPCVLPPPAPLHHCSRVQQRSSHAPPPPPAPSSPEPPTQPPPQPPHAPI